MTEECYFCGAGSNVCTLVVHAELGDGRFVGLEGGLRNEIVGVVDSNFARCNAVGVS